MLGKLMKYDFRCCVRKFGPMWLGLAALAVLNGFTVGHVLENSRIEGFMSFLLGGVPILLLVSLWVALGVMMLVFICQRFYKGLLGDEGYLMFTLPATSAEHIASKLLVAFFMELITAAVALVSGFLFLLVYDPSALSDLAGLIREGLEYLAGMDLPAGLGWFVAEMIVFALVTSLVGTLQIYLAIALGHLAKKNRLAWSVAAYIGINIALSILLRVAAQFMSGSVEKFFFWFDEAGFHGSMAPALAALGVVLLWQLIKGAAFFFGTNAILTDRLNLE